MEEGGGEDDEEEAYSKNLMNDESGISQSILAEEWERVEGKREKHTKDRAMIVLRPAAILMVCRVRWLGAWIMLSRKACAT